MWSLATLRYIPHPFHIDVTLVMTNQAVHRLTHIQVLVVDLCCWFSSKRGPFRLWLVEPALIMVVSLPWEAFAYLLGVSEVDVFYGKQVGTNDLFCDSHALSIICQLIGGRSLKGSSHHTFKRTKEVLRRWMVS